MENTNDVAIDYAKLRYCSFCGKDNECVTSMIYGPGDVIICDECVDICNKILRGEIL